MQIKITNDDPEKEPTNVIQAAVDKASAAGAKSLDIELAAGIYRLSQPVLISSDMGFTRVNITGENRGRTIICGSLPIKADWQLHHAGIYRAQIAKNLDFDMLYINGKYCHMARYPKYDPDEIILNGYAEDCIEKEKTAGWANPAGGYFHALHKHRWGDFHYRITGKDSGGLVRLEGGTQNNRRLGVHDTFRYVENIYEELTAENEWYYDKRQGHLFVFFEAGVAPEAATVEAVVSEQLIKVVGSENAMQKAVILNNITFRHTRRTFMNVSEPLLRSDWCIYRSGALFFENTCDCRVENCDLIDMGSNAIFVNGKNTRVSVRSCLISDIGANGVCFVGKAECVRSPLFEYNERNKLSETDLERGPKSDLYPSQCEVVDCLITRTGQVEKQTAGVQISISRAIRVAHCSIYELPRAGVNISEGNFGGHLIEYCDIFDAVRETSDHGCFNSWGRDRYYELEGVDTNNLKALMLQHLPFLDAVDTTKIMHNRIRCDHGWDIDLDDGSSNYEISSNLCLNGGIKLREGFSRTVRNNITVNNSIHVHVWFKDSGDVIRNNILFEKYKPIRMDFEWGDEVDHNIVHSQFVAQRCEPARLLQKDSRQDLLSIICNCQFKNPAKGNYTVDNPVVFETGYANFDMNRFGVQTSYLKTLARIPEMPAIRPLLNTEDSSDNYFRHYDAVFKNITSMEEASAYGAGTLDGVIVLDLSPLMPLAEKGIQTGDIILSIDDVKIHAVKDLTAFFTHIDSPEHVKFKILREQAEQIL